VRGSAALTSRLALLRGDRIVGAKEEVHDGEVFTVVVRGGLLGGSGKAAGGGGGGGSSKGKVTLDGLSRQLFLDAAEHVLHASLRSACAPARPLPPADIAEWVGKELPKRYKRDPSRVVAGEGKGTHPFVVSHFLHRCVAADRPKLADKEAQRLADLLAVHVVQFGVALPPDAANASRPQCWEVKTRIKGAHDGVVSVSFRWLQDGDDFMHALPPLGAPLAVAGDAWQAVWTDDSAGADQASDGFPERPQDENKLSADNFPVCETIFCLHKLAFFPADALGRPPASPCRPPASPCRPPPM
jgi:hypothetical protein